MIIETPLLIDVIGTILGWYALLGAIYIILASYIFKKTHGITLRDYPGAEHIPAIWFGLSWPIAIYYWLKYRSLKQAVILHADDMLRR
jgi:hypothetical protein